MYDYTVQTSTELLPGNKEVVLALIFDLKTDESKNVPEKFL